MERLTMRNSDGSVSQPTRTSVEAVFYRLAAYEDAIPLERAQELVQAEKDGRLVVMPVKEGTKIYRLGYRLGGAYAIEERYFSLTYYRDDVLGETIFLTREEAEAALKKMEADNETD